MEVSYNGREYHSKIELREQIEGSQSARVQLPLAGIVEEHWKLAEATLCHLHEAIIGNPTCAGSVLRIQYLNTPQRARDTLN